MQRGAALMAGMAIGLLSNRVFYAPWRSIVSADNSLMPFLLNCHAADVPQTSSGSATAATAKFYEYFTCEGLHLEQYAGYYSLNVDLCFSL